MIETKFRAQIIGRPALWVKGDYFSQHKDRETKHYIVEHPFGRDNGRETMREVDPETLGRYTGFKDKNGVEVYEGDILETNGIDGRLLWQVEYRNDGLGGSLSSFEAEPINHQLSSVHNRIIEEGEIVGDIHDNPGLLEVKK